MTALVDGLGVDDLAELVECANVAARACPDAERAARWRDLAERLGGALVALLIPQIAHAQNRRKDTP